MNKLLHAQIGNVVQNGIYNALNGNLSLKEAIMDAKYSFKYIFKKLNNHKRKRYFFQIESLIKRGYFELSNLGQIVNYQRTHRNKKTTNRYDFEFSKNKLKKNGLIVELKCVWSKPDPFNKRILKQVLRYKKNSTKDCMLCFLNVITDSKGKFVNAFCYWFSVNHHKR